MLQGLFVVLGAILTGLGLGLLHLVIRAGKGGNFKKKIRFATIGVLSEVIGLGILVYMVLPLV